MRTQDAGTKLAKNLITCLPNHKDVYLLAEDILVYVASIFSALSSSILQRLAWLLSTLP